MLEKLFQVEDGAALIGMRIGLLAMRGCAMTIPLDAYRGAEAEAVALMRERFGGMDRKTLRTIPPVDAYAAYYKKFSQNYRSYSSLNPCCAGIRGSTRIRRCQRHVRGGALCHAATRGTI
jgi:hypothetical protein